MFWSTNMFHVHVIMSVDALSRHANLVFIPIAASSDWIAFAVVHLCPSPRPQCLACERGRRPTTHDDYDGKKRQKF